MQTLVRIKLSELSLEKVQQIFEILSVGSTGKDTEIFISTNIEIDENQAFFMRLDESIKQIENGESKVFSIEELTSILVK